MIPTAIRLTAEDYLRLPKTGQPTELVQGQVVPMNRPAPRHGEICAQVVYLLRRYLEQNDRGRVVCNDAGVVTARDPDTVRGVDVAFYSYARMPRGSLPPGYLSEAPELVFEIRSPSDRWRDILEKVTGYFNAGVLLVCVLDPQTQMAYVYHPDQPPRKWRQTENSRSPRYWPSSGFWSTVSSSERAS
jgi:Uma2 family endonuclease